MSGTTFSPLAQIFENSNMPPSRRRSRSSSRSHDRWFDRPQYRPALIIVTFHCVRHVAPSFSLFRERAPSPTPTVPGHVPATRLNAPDSTHSMPNPLDPAIADHRNCPWPPADDRTLIRFKLDTKSRPSWKTIATRLNRTADSCQARWQWLKNTNSPLLNPETPDQNQAADD